MTLSAVPHLDQWFGVWAMEPTRLLALRDACAKLDLKVHLNGPEAAASQERSSGGSNLDVRSGVACIAIHGRMMKHASSLGDATSTVAVRRELRAAGASDEVGAVLMVIDSPGGSAAGTADLADDVAVVASRKPVYAFIEDLGASAAYWAASRATKIFANASALVGSIGTYGVVYDYSGAAAMEGIKVHVVKAGEFKGAGTPGTVITDAHLAEMQRIVVGVNEHFLTGVAAGRRMSREKLATVADGRVHFASDAIRLGLIDGVASLGEVFTSLATFAARQVAERPGVQPVRAASDPIAEWNAGIATAVARGASQSQAVRQLVRSNPTLHAAYLAEFNSRAAARARR